MTNVTHKFLSKYLFLFLTLYMIRAHRAHHQERQTVSIQPLVTVTLCRWPCRVQVGSEPNLHTTRPPEVVLTQFVSPDDEHDVLETCRELKIKINTQKGICASRWSFTKNLKQSTLVAFTPLIYTFLSTDISSRPGFILFLFEINTSGFTSAPKPRYFFLPFFQFAFL